MPVSGLCDRHQLNPNVFFRWQKQIFENGAAAFEQTRNSKRPSADTEKSAALEAQLAKKNEVVAELLEEHINLKKRTSGSLADAGRFEAPTYYVERSRHADAAYRLAIENLLVERRKL